MRTGAFVAGVALLAACSSNGARAGTATTAATVHGQCSLSERGPSNGVVVTAATAEPRCVAVPTTTAPPRHECFWMKDTASGGSKTYSTTATTCVVVPATTVPSGG